MISRALLFESPWTPYYTGVGSLSFLQGILPTQGSNLCLPHCRWILYQLSHKESPRILAWVTYPFSRGSSWARNRTRVSCIAGGFFTNWTIREAQHYYFWHYILGGYFEHFPVIFLFSVLAYLLQGCREWGLHHCLTLLIALAHYLSPMVIIL